MSETLRKYGAKYNTTFCSLCGLSTDTKPTGSFNGISIANGSEFIEMDTNKKYLYDAENQQWNLASSGGGGGGGSVTLIEKSITENGEYNASSDNADGYSKVTVDVAGGGGETFDVTVKANVNPASGGKLADIVEMSHTVLEITTALNENKNVVITQEYYSDGQLLFEVVSTYNYIMSNDNIMTVFVFTSPEDGTLQCSWYITSDGLTTYAASQFPV